jgi:acetyl-CoA C-acetyltransferase
MGSFQGALAPLSATELGATAVKAAVDRAGLKGEQIDKVFMGNVLSAGLGQAPARQAALGADLPMKTEAVTVNKVCGSGMQAAIFAHDMLAANSADVIVAGGMESMTNAPYLSKKYRSGATGSRMPMSRDAPWAPSPRKPRRNISSRARTWTLTRSRA